MAEIKKVEEIVENNTNAATTAIGENQELQAVTTFFKKYQNFIFIGLGAIALGVIAYMFLGKKGDPIRALKNDASLMESAQYLGQDSFDIALNGSGGNIGLLQVIKKSSGTTTEKIARIDAAMCYLRKGQPKDAIKMLKEATGFGKQINARRLSLLGDATSELATETATTNNKLAEEAIDYYKDAANEFTDDASSAVYLFKVAQLQEKLNKLDDAKKTYTTIKEKYSENEAIMNDVEKYLGKLGVTN
jgi:tetratricopeptide (TPR) repeat protein